MQGWNERWIDVAGIRTRYLEIGSGPPLVLFHGGEMGHRYQADSAYVWRLNGVLGRDFRVIAIDSLGQGLTDNPTIDGDYTMAARVRHAIDTMLALGLDQAGHLSMREQHAAFNEALRGFIAATDPA